MWVKKVSFNENSLENLFIDLFTEEGYDYCKGSEIIRNNKTELIIFEDLFDYFKKKYSEYNLSFDEINDIKSKIENIPFESDYESNKKFLSMLIDGFNFKRENDEEDDLFINLIDFDNIENNIFKFVNQFEIEGHEKSRIPDGIVFINGIPLVVCEFKSAIKEHTTIYDAYEQLTITYARDIPELFKYNAFLVISDGVNTKYGTLFTDYEYFTSWKFSKKIGKVDKSLDYLYTLVNGMLNKKTLLKILHDFIYFPDNSNTNKKIICRYSQYYGVNALENNIFNHLKPNGDGKGGTYFGATGSGKSYLMLYLCRKLMQNSKLRNPTIILINDSISLDSQLSELFENSTEFIGDANIVKFKSKNDLKSTLKNHGSGGVFLTTIQKFAENLELLSDRSNIICISDEAHKSQLNLESTTELTEDGLIIKHGFAKCLHASLPQATYVGFTGTPIDKTIEVFGSVVESYNLLDAKNDDIIVDFRYLPAKAELRLNEKYAKIIEDYYDECEKEGTNEYQINASKKALLSLKTLIGDKDRLKKIAKNFVELYEERVQEQSTVEGKALFVCTDRNIAYDFYKEVIELKPEWADEGYIDGLTEREMKDIKPMPKIKMVMTRSKKDKKELYDLLGTKEDRKDAEIQYKKVKSNFKIAILVDMWLTGFDVPSLDTMFIDKAIKKHTLIQTISRVNRKYKNKTEGLIVDYIGIRKELDEAVNIYTGGEKKEVDDITPAVNAVKTQLSILKEMLYDFDLYDYYSGNEREKFECLKRAAEFVQESYQREKKFMGEVLKLKTAYNICSLSEDISKDEKDQIFLYTSIRSLIYKYNKNDAPDEVQMNKRVLELVEAAIESDDVKIILEKTNEGHQVLSPENLERIKQIKYPNTRIKLLTRVMEKEIKTYKKTNKLQAIEFTKKLQALIDKYNQLRDEKTTEQMSEDIVDEIIKLGQLLEHDKKSFEELKISPEEKAIYDILKNIEDRYNISVDKQKRIDLSKDIKLKIDEISETVDWMNREDSKNELKATIKILLVKHEYKYECAEEIFSKVYDQAKLFNVTNIK